MRLVRLVDVTPQPWKNGGGETRELLRVPMPGGITGADDWLLRISVAEIAADGPFSAFPGVQRHFAVLEGAGVRLRWPRGERVHTRLSGALEFDGADPPDCALVDGPTRDLNVMVRRAAAQVLLVPAETGLVLPWPWLDGPCGVFAQRAAVLRRDGHEPLALAAGTLAWSPAGDSAAWNIHAADEGVADAQNPGRTQGPIAWKIALRAPHDPTAAP